MRVRPETIASVERLMAADGMRFADLVRLAGLDPAADFRFRDLRGADLSGQDLRAFDFVASDLSCTDLSGSHFAEGALLDCRLTGAEMSGVILGGVKLVADDLPDLAVFREAEFAPEMVVIPGGTFLMGSPEDEPGRRDDEGPQHEVTVPRFALGLYTVTFAEYDHFCEATDREKPGDSGWGRDDRPVINISWEDAIAYCEWLSDETGREYRLPSEAEWEYACRAGTVARFWWGETITPDQANYRGTQAYNGGGTGVYRQRTVPVRSFEPNPFGLWQVHGNVYEWCADRWHDSYEGSPADGSIWPEREEWSNVLRGGSWVYQPFALRCAYRFRLGFGNRDNYIGFRIARTLTI